MKIRSISIRGYIIGFFACLIALLIIYFSIILYHRNLEKDDSYIIDIAGRNRMLSQKIGFYAEIIARGNESVKRDLLSAIELHEKSINVLEKGGIAPGLEGQIQIAPSPEEVQNDIRKAQILWKQYKENALKIANSTKKNNNISSSEIASALKFIEENGHNLLLLNNKIVQHYVAISARRKVNFIVTLISISVAVLIFFAIAFRFLNQNILKVLKTIGEVADEVAEGTFSRKIPNQVDIYLGKIANAINDLGGNINQASMFANSIGQGKFDFEFETKRGGNRLFDELVKMRDQLKKVAEDDAKRNWVTKGLAHFADILRDDKRSINELGDTIISECVSYLEANQGSLFIIAEEGDEKFMELLSCYAWDRKKFNNKRIHKGQSLVGQSWLERDTIYLRDIPNDYIEITSGLGEANPKEILIVPLMSNKEVFGAIELASFTRFENYQIEFLEKLGENIAATLSSANVMKETNLLLEQTQQQTEEMRAQEEEMRQNMEELQSTQEAMERQTNEIERIKQDLEIRESVFDRTTILSEADPYGTITYVNNKLCEVAKYSREEMIGQPHSLFRHKDMPKELFRHFWDTIKKGEVFNGIIKNKAKDGSVYWVDTTIVPIKENGKIKKYIGARYHITNEDFAIAMYNLQADRLKLSKHVCNEEELLYS
ncbi:PAS domain-containing protein [Fulvivirga sp. 29W222]|uniref:PAS domain-containing protein n=1 Tax=Fulvivirga marina TaxID=2494733 RepID=A0A937KB26_9BACT|nr:PAS domain-containing protein [Fulvivirga marina]MBL6445339.1 PAS domain-containing protein [Fulvivirga marina]